MLDIHTHILPKVDDGSRNISQSLKMLRQEARHGVDYVALTPHFYADKESPERFLKRRNAALALLEQEVAGRRRMPQLIPGAEVAYFVGMSRAEIIEELCLGDTNAILVEMPFGKWNRNIFEELNFLKKCRGVRPIVAHVERYLKYQPMGTVRRLCEEGIWIQANASFFDRWQTKWLAMRMLKKREIHFIGSDCHNMKHRDPNLDFAYYEIDERLGERTLRYLERMEQRLLEGR